MGSAIAKGKPAGTLDVLSFVLGGTTFGVPVRRVREVLPYGDETRAPESLAPVRGVIDLRGSPLPVVDLGLRFGRPEAVPTPRSSVVVVEARVGGTEFLLGLLADAVNGVVTLEEGDVEPMPELVAGAAPPPAGPPAAAGSLVLFDVDASLAEIERARAARRGPSERN